MVFIFILKNISRSKSSDGVYKTINILAIL